MSLEGDETVDVELLAECGQIALRLRDLEQTWSIDLKDLQRKTLCCYRRPPLATSHSVTQKLNEIFDSNEHSDENKSDTGYENRLRHLEDTVIKIHHQQELLKRPAATNNRNFHGKSNMNYSAASATKHNNNDLTTSPTALRDDRPQSFGSHSHSCTPGDSSRDNNNKSLTNFDVDLSNKQQQNISHQQQQLCAKIHSSDLRMLIRELKRKVDYTEKMNWMCEFQILENCFSLISHTKFDLGMSLTCGIKLQRVCFHETSRNRPMMWKNFLLESSIQVFGSVNFIQNHFEYLEIINGSKINEIPIAHHRSIFICSQS